jgi:hypothetical protein
MAVYAINMEGDGMSRKDYELIVGVLAQAYLGSDRRQSVGVERAVELMIQALSADNVRFDEQRFLNRFGVLVREGAK